jgi:hypothetical protein
MFRHHYAILRGTYAKLALKSIAVYTILYSYVVFTKC